MIRSSFIARLFAGLVIGLMFALQPIAAHAVNPDEMLADPVLEKRARALSSELRCMVCQNESIDDSNAELAKDLRLLVRDRLTKGDTDQEVMDYVVFRYGEFVLLKPRFTTRTALLWGFPVFILMIGTIALILASRSRRKNTEALKPLTDGEKAELSRLLDKN